MSGRSLYLWFSAVRPQCTFAEFIAAAHRWALAYNPENHEDETKSTEGGNVISFYAENGENGKTYVGDAIRVSRDESLEPNQTWNPC
jgi:hypothetical protein